MKINNWCAIKIYESNKYKKNRSSSECNQN